MSPGIETASSPRALFSRLGDISKLLGVGLVCVSLGTSTLQADARASIEARAADGAACATPLVPAQAADDEQRGCCVFVTADGPRCTYTSRGYCTMRAAEAGVRFEFHTVASCSDLPQCR